MKLLIDNLDGLGPKDYTAFVDSKKSLSLVRKLNHPAEFKFGLMIKPGSTLVPALLGRVVLSSNNGSNLFTGYIVQTPPSQYSGWADGGVIYRYEVDVLSDVMLMDEKAPPVHPPFVDRSAGSALQQLTAEALPSWFDTSSVQSGDTIPYFSVDPAKKWTALAAEIALSGRCSYRDDNGKLYFAPLAANVYPLNESSATFSPADLQLQSVNRVVNDLTILGPLEPGAHVKDYFVGDGATTKFYMSQKPFTRISQVPLYNRTILDEVYAELDPAHWSFTDPANAISVSNSQLQIAGGTGIDGQTLLTFIEKIELGGATVLEHGDVVFNAASDGVIGGLYAGPISIAGCLAGFRITPSGSNCAIQALVGGSTFGAAVATQAGNHYVFTTRLYPREVYRMQQVYHSSLHPSGSPRGGAAVGCDVRVVLEIRNIDPTNPATQIAAATVLYDGVISNAPSFCIYALINAANLHASVAFTYAWLPIDAVVRSTLSGQAP
jgi:hypothetical protein